MKTTQYQVKIFNTEDKLIKTDLITITDQHDPEAMIVATLDTYKEIYPESSIDMEVSYYEKETKIHKITHSYKSNIYIDYAHIK